MQSISRYEAIKLFGREVGVTSFNFPIYDYPENFLKVNIEMAINIWGPKSNHSPIIILEEVLGNKKPLLSSKKGEWPTFIDDLFEGKDMLSSAHIANKIKDHAVKTYDEARLKFEQMKAYETPKGIFARASKAMSRNKPLPMGADLFSKLRVEVNYLPETIEIPETTLKIGGNVYQVLSHDIKNNGTSIIEHRVTDIKLKKTTKMVPNPSVECSCDFNVVTLNDTYDIKYTVKSSDKGMPIHFELNNDGCFKGLITGDCFNPGGHFFLTSSGAKNAENKIWWDVEKQLNKYRDRTKTPSPA